MRRLKNQWGDRSPSTGKLTADQLQYRADLKLMIWSVIGMSLIMALDIFAC